MSLNFLEFEQPIAELEAKIESLRAISRQGDSTEAVDLEKEIAQLELKSTELTKKIFGSLGAWQVAQLARHPSRPYTLDYAHHIFTEFEELAGDRAFADDKAIVGGLARLEGQAVMIIGHQKGRQTREKVLRNFGMPKPEGYRKALRLMKMAERFKLPVITFIDTAGAYPGIDAEERSQSFAIAQNLKEMAGLNVPIICNVV
ncbi:MAG: acetyl-CoA carboxylase carboxyl transferase subunit alpha, partial [Enterovibrio sp.]